MEKVSSQLISSNAAFSSFFAAQGLCQSSGGILLHDAGRTLGANDAVIQRVVRITVDITYLTVAEMYAHATATSAHVTGSCLDLNFRVG